MVAERLRFGDVEGALALLEEPIAVGSALVCAAYDERFSAKATEC